jgi:hypothetical protein
MSFSWLSPGFSLSEISPHQIVLIIRYISPPFAFFLSSASYMLGDMDAMVLPGDHVFQVNIFQKNEIEFDPR